MDIQLIATVNHPMILDTLLFAFSFRIFLSFAILITKTIIGIDTIPLIIEL